MDKKCLWHKDRIVEYFLGTTENIFSINAYVFYWSGKTILEKSYIISIEPNNTLHLFYMAPNSVRHLYYKPSEILKIKIGYKLSTYFLFCYAIDVFLWYFLNYSILPLCDLILSYFWIIVVLITIILSNIWFVKRYYLRKIKIKTTTITFSFNYPGIGFSLESPKSYIKKFEKRMLSIK